MNKDMDEKQQYQVEDSLKLLLLKNAYIEIVAFLKKIGQISPNIRETIKQHMNNSANIISQDQQIDIESVFDTIITLYSNNYNSTESFNETELVRNVLKHYIDNGDSKYIFVFYQLKTTQITGESQKIRWLLAADKFFPYFASTINSTIADDFGALLEQGAKLYKNNICSLLQLVPDKEDRKDEQKQVQKLRDQYQLFIKNSLEYIVKFGAKQEYSNSILLNFLHKMIPTDFYFVHNSSVLYPTLFTFLTHLPISISHSPTLLVTLPPLLFINIARYMYLPLHSKSSNLSFYWISELLLITLPESANGQHPFNNVGKETEEEIKQLVKSLCDIINEKNLWDDPKLMIRTREKKTHLFSLLPIFRRLIIYLGYLSPVYDEKLHKQIKSTIICYKNASVINQLIFWEYCLQEATNLKEPLEYRNYLINNYRSVILQSRNLGKDKKQQFFHSITLTEKNLKKEIEFSCQEMQANNIGYVISFVMNYLALLNCKNSLQMFQERQRSRLKKEIWEKMKVLTKKLEIRSQESQSQNQRDRFDLCLLRIKEIQSQNEQLLDDS